MTVTEAELEAAPRVAPETLREWMERGLPVTVIDVRQAEARSEWRIPGSLHVDAYEALRAGSSDALAGAELPAGVPVVAVCNVGRTSRIAAHLLREGGVEAFSLAGGMKAWSLAWNRAEVEMPGSPARVIQVRRTGKGCLSYLISAGGEAAVVDPAVEVRVYLDLAREAGARIRKVLETHVHADHLSRGRALAEAAGAELLMPDQGPVRFPFEPVHDGDAIVLGPVRIDAMRLPGHTMESTVYLLDGRALMTGDTLFLAGVGRPDLATGSSDEARARAHALYRSLQRLMGLPAETLVLPAHTNEPVPFDGRPLCGKLAEVRRGLPLLDEPEDAFVETILGRIPPTPPNHLRIVELNEAGVLPEGDLTDLEAGANRCAVS